MAGRIPQGIVLRGTADYKGEKTSKPDYRSFIASFDVANIRGCKAQCHAALFFILPPHFAAGIHKFS